MSESKSETKSFHVHAMNVEAIKAIKLKAVELGVSIAEVIALAVKSMRREVR